MENKNLYIIGAGIGIVLILLGTFLGYYLVKYQKNAKQLLAEKDARGKLERQIARLQSELSMAKQELSAKENMVQIYKHNLDSLKERMGVISEEKNGQIYELGIPKP